MAQSAARDFDAVVLALDFDTAISNLTDQAPPSYLPVANRPLICYQLEHLVKSGIERIHIVTSTEFLDVLKSIIDVNFRWLCGSAADKVNCIPVSASDTATALREARHLLGITRDFFLIAGDSITNVPLDPLISVHLHRDAIATVLTKAKPQAVATPEGKVPPEMDFDDLSQDIYAIDPASNRILYARSLADVQDEKIVLPKQVMDSYPDILFTGALETSYIYLLSPVVLNLLNEKTDFVDFRSEVVSYLIATQFDQKSQGFLHHSYTTFQDSESSVSSSSDNDVAIGFGLEGNQPVDNESHHDVYDEAGGHTSSSLSLKALQSSSCGKRDPVRVFMVVAPPAASSIVTRVTSVESYLSLNKVMVASSAQATATANAKAAADAAAQCAETNVQISQEATAAAAATTTVSSAATSAAIAGPWTPAVSHTSEYSIKSSVPRVTIVDARFGESVEVGKCTIINSVIGHRVTLKEGCAIRNSIIMDDCIVESGANIQDSVVCNHAVIQTKCQLKKCTVRKNEIVEEGSKFENADL